MFLLLSSAGSGGGDGVTGVPPMLYFVKIPSHGSRVLPVG